jgi:hypothetical protein
LTEQSQSRPVLNRWELGAAAIFFLLGLYMAIEGSHYGLGSITRIGPGFFPVSIGVLLMILSVGVAFEVRHSLAAAPKIPLRITLVIAVALLSFALLVNTAGLIPAIFAVVFIARFAEPGNNVVASAILAAGLALVGWLAFIVGFNLPLKPFWW